MKKIQVNEKELCMYKEKYKKKSQVKKSHK